jgi:hypothetical protein
VKGLVRPCRHHLGPQLQLRWAAHLCGLCLTLRDEAGQPARVLTGYDALLLSVLVEAQAGRQPTRTAGRCPLRGMRTAEVVRADTGAMQLAAAGSLLTGAAGLADKLADGDLPYGTRGAAGAAARRITTHGIALARRVGLDPQPQLAAASRAAEVESRPGACLHELLAPTGAVVAALFAQTAAVSGRPENAAALELAGDGYGRLVHLLDAVDDAAADLRRGRFNPLTATGTAPAEAHQLAVALSRQVSDAVQTLAMAEPELALALLGPELDRAVTRSFPGRNPHPQLALSGALAATALMVWPGRRRDKRKRRCEGASDCCCDLWCCDACDCCSVC